MFNLIDGMTPDEFESPYWHCIAFASVNKRLARLTLLLPTGHIMVTGVGQPVLDTKDLADVPENMIRLLRIERGLKLHSPLRSHHLFR